MIVKIKNLKVGDVINDAPYLYGKIIKTETTKYGFCNLTIEFPEATQEYSYSSGETKTRLIESGVKISLKKWKTSHNEKQYFIHLKSIVLSEKFGYGKVVLFWKNHINKYQITIKYCRRIINFHYETENDFFKIHSLIEKSTNHSIRNWKKLHRKK